MNLIPLLRDTPAEFFTEQDYALFDSALRKALDELATDGVAQWENPQTRAAGSVTVGQEFERAGSPCKRLRIENRANHRVGRTTFDFCRQADGRWVLAPAQ
jgi:surface antigen